MFRQVRAIAPPVLLGLFGSVMAACGGGGGNSSSLQAPPTPASIAFHKPSPQPSVAPTAPPVSCAAALVAHRMHTHTLVPARRVAAIPARVGPGPAMRACDDTTPGHMHCMAWIRTDVMGPELGGPFGYAPSDLQSAYNLAAAASTNGGTQTVAVVDAFDDPNAEADLGVYRSTFGLPACTTANGCFVKVNQSGMTAPLPASDSKRGWEAEEALDLDMVSAVCPNCSIVLVEANSSYGTDLYTAEDTAATTCAATVVSNSWGGSEYSSERADESHFHHGGVVILVASGDLGYDGASSGYPAVSQYVTAVGGTSLHTTPSRSETVWSGSGSKCSQYIAQPAWQISLGAAYTSVCANRIENDVAAVADPNTGVAVYDSFGGMCSGWCVFGGTSAATPIIAAVYALAGNGASVTAGSYPYAHTSSLFDITSGSNGTCGSTFLCTAKVGYDGPTGNGSPNGIGAF